MGNKDQVEKLKAVLDLALVINGVRSFSELFQQVVQRTSQILEAERTSLYIYDDTSKKLWTLVAEGLKNRIFLPLNRGLAGKCAATGEMVLVEDAYQDPNFDPTWDYKHGYRTRSVFCCPIYTRDGELKGVFQAINKKSGRAFGAEDVKLGGFISAQIGVALENYFLVEEIRTLLESLVLALVTTIDAKHPLTAGHSERVMEYSLFLGRKLGLDPGELEILKYAALLHDIGKMAIPDAVLTKRGPFTPEERSIMKQHPLWTEKVLNRIKWPAEWKKLPHVAACHHERLDGKGYPYGLKGEEIPRFSRILAIADIFDALTSKRDYPKYDSKGRLAHTDVFGIEKAIQILKEIRGDHLDPFLVDLFVENTSELQVIYDRLHGKKC